VKTRVLAPALVCALILVSSAGCVLAEPEEHDGGTQGGVVERARPFVTAVTPLPGERIDAGTAAVVVFSRAVDRDSVERGISVSPRVELRTIWIDDKTLRMEPVGGWPESCRVTVSITPQDDEDGFAPFEWSFVVEVDYLEVESVDPRPDEDGVPLDQPLEITFDRDVDPSSAETALSINPPAEGRVECDGRTLVFIPAGGWAPSEVYEVTLRNDPIRGVKTESGRVLREPFESSFRTVSRSAVWSVRADGSGLERLGVVDETLCAAVWLPGGRIGTLVERERDENGIEVGWTGMPAVFDPETASLGFLLDEGIWSETNDFNAAWSRDGRAMLAATQGAEDGPSLWKCHVDGRKERLPIPEDEGMLKPANPVWSPDGSMVAVRLFGDWKSHICVIGSDGSGFQELATFDVHVPEYSFRGLRWSPDGTCITTEEEEADGQLAVWRVPLDGTEPEKLFVGWRHSWSLDGRRIAFVNRAVCVYEVETGDVRVVARPKGYVRWGPEWSDDGRWLAFESAERYYGPAKGF